ncbi:MAG: hypothetical protein DCC58_16105 [Chloroflexi bacterium]|nr:MAG: hypothetical protein DCC58_16105 [Chloroflexota bacterium]
MNQARMRYGAYRGGMYYAGGSDCSDLFAINPLRRSATVVAVSAALLFGPIFFLHGDTRALFLIAGGWLAATGIIMCTPIVIWCLIEEAVLFVRRRITPPIEELDLSPRAYNLLRRHGFESIASVEQTPDSSLALLSNMDARAIREIRRAISIWRYRRWQERGFPADDMP